MILADTSAWVEFDRATGSRAHRRLATLVQTESGLAITEPVLMEVLAGVRTESRWQDMRRLLLSCRMLSFVPATDFEAAARLYRQCRAAGVTPRGLLDCAIASVARRTGCALLAHDVDLARIASVLNIDLDIGSLTTS